MYVSLNCSPLPFCIHPVQETFFFLNSGCPIILQAYDNNKSVYIFKRLFRISIDVKRRRFQRFIQYNISSMLQPALLRAVPLSCLWLTWPGFTVNTSVSGVLPRSLLFFIVGAEKEGGGCALWAFKLATVMPLSAQRDYCAPATSWR